MLTELILQVFRINYMKTMYTNKLEREKEKPFGFKILVLLKSTLYK